ncbi:hypothetical protein SAMN05518847_102704 [Paenibacillus sp. OV219]|nr:hypothetical protein SAMN05518847_102704 [Paenibacillus sp. OV219]
MWSNQAAARMHPGEAAIVSADEVLRQQRPLPRSEWRRRGAQWVGERSSMVQPESLRAAFELGMQPLGDLIQAFRVQQRPQAHLRTEWASCQTFPTSCRHERPLLSPHHGYGIIFLVMLMIRPFRRRVGKPTLYVLSAPFSPYRMYNDRISHEVDIQLN